MTEDLSSLCIDAKKFDDKEELPAQQTDLPLYFSSDATVKPDLRLHNRDFFDRDSGRARKNGIILHKV
ncbi:MAG: hypothetical protein ABIJ16_03990, partial [Bacteroidota bacterium]